MAWTQQITTAGTLTLPTGSRLLSVRVQSVNAGGTLVILGGPTIPVVGGAADRSTLHLHAEDFDGRAIASGTGAAAQVVTANTESTLVVYDTPPGT